MRIGKHIPSGGANGEDHDGGGDSHGDDKCSGLKKKKEKNKMGSRQM